MMAFVTSCTSCKNDVQFGIEYSLTSDGTADGNVTFFFNGGSFNLDGSADYQFTWASSIIWANADGLDLEQALASKDNTTAETAKKVDDWLNNMITVESLSGTYDIYVKGYIKEIATGLTFAINKHFTNIETPDDTVDYE